MGANEAYNLEMMNYSEHIGYVFGAELQFRLASAVRLATTMGQQPLDLPVEWSHGKHKVEYKEVALREDQAEIAAAALHHSATYLMAVAMKDAIRAARPDPKNDSNPDVVGAYQIARLIRNAFAHSPFNPIWSIDSDCRDRAFAVTDIIALDATGLQGAAFDWRHYGGPLALLRLSQFVRFEILGDTSTKPSDRVVPDPSQVYYQQGSLILRKIGD
jgi:hypothetical protein